MMRLETPMTVLAWVYIERLTSTNDTARKNLNVKVPGCSCVACSLQFEALTFVIGIPHRARFLDRWTEKHKSQSSI